MTIVYSERKLCNRCGRFMPCNDKRELLPHTLLLTGKPCLDEPMELKRQSVNNFLNALREWYPEVYHWYWDLAVYSDTLLLQGLVSSCRLPATWVNQAIQASILLQELNQ